MSSNEPHSTPRLPPHRKRFKCSQCDKAYTRKFILQEHVRTHTGEKPECCPKCSEGFTRKSDLKRHMDICIQKIRYNCGGCDKDFTRKYDLKRHQCAQNHTFPDDFKTYVPTASSWPIPPHGNSSRQEEKVLVEPEFMHSDVFAWHTPNESLTADALGETGAIEMNQCAHGGDADRSVSGFIPHIDEFDFHGSLQLTPDIFSYEDTIFIGQSEENGLVLPRVLIESGSNTEPSPDDDCRLNVKVKSSPAEIWGYCMKHLKSLHDYFRRLSTNCFTYGLCFSTEYLLRQHLLTTPCQFAQEFRCEFGCGGTFYLQSVLQRHYSADYSDHNGFLCPAIEKKICYIRNDLIFSMFSLGFDSLESRAQWLRNESIELSDYFSQIKSRALMEFKRRSRLPEARLLQAGVTIPGSSLYIEPADGTNGTRTSMPRCMRKIIYRLMNFGVFGAEDAFPLDLWQMRNMSLDEHIMRGLEGEYVGNF